MSSEYPNPMDRFYIDPEFKETTHPFTVTVEYEDFELLSRNGKRLGIDDADALNYVVSEMNRWTVERSRENNLIIAVDSVSHIGEKLTSPVIEKAKGSESHDFPLNENRVDGVRRKEVGEIELPLDVKAGNSLSQAELMTGIPSLNVHYKHGNRFLDWALERLTEGWVISAYDVETARNKVLTFPQLEASLSLEQMTEVLLNVHKWRERYIPVAA